MSTHVYRNDGIEDLNIPGIAILGPGDQVSITSKFQPPIIIENYRGLVDVLEEEAAAPVAPVAPEPPAAPVSTSTPGTGSLKGTTITTTPVNTEGDSNG